MKKLLISFIVGLGFLVCSVVAQATVPTMVVISERATAPTTPAAAHYYIYALSADSTLYGKGDDGTAHDLEAGAGTLSGLTDTDITSPATGSVLWYNGSKWVDLDVGTEGQILTVSGDTVNWEAGGGADTNADYTATFPAGSLYYPTSGATAAVLNVDTGNNLGNIWRWIFGDSDDTTVQGLLVIPPDMAAGTVTFEIYGYATTAAADDVVFDFRQRPLTSNESWDQTWATTESSGAKTCDATQDDFDRHIWTETTGNLGWAANDIVLFYLTRDGDNILDDLSGNYGVVSFRVIIPRS